MPIGEEWKHEKMKKTMGRRESQMERKWMEGEGESRIERLTDEEGGMEEMKEYIMKKKKNEKGQN